MEEEAPGAAVVGELALIGNLATVAAYVFALLTDVYYLGGSPRSAVGDRIGYWTPIRS